MSVAFQPSIPATTFPHREQFHRAKKGSNESISEWYGRLLSMANLCQFGFAASLIILDKFVFGLEEKYVRRLSQEVDDLTLEQLVKVITQIDASSYQNQFESAVKTYVPSCGSDTGNELIDNIKAENVKQCSRNYFVLF